MKRFIFSVLFTLTAACAGQRVTEYSGSAMNAAMPEAEGRLRLTLYSRTDTSFGGVIDLGAPMKVRGGAYAWLEGSELRIVTVGAQSGDTIKWYSPLAGAEIGGRFEVIGGPRTGQRGTWRAKLVAGLPTTAATLRTPQLVPLPSPAALWPIVVLLLVAVALTPWILRAPRGATTDGVRWRAPPSPLSGIGGWLLLFVIGRVIALLAWAPQFRTSWHNYLGSIGIATAVTGMQPLIVLETAVAFLGFPLTLVGLVLLLRRSPYAPRYWFAFLAVTAGYSLLDVGVMHFIRPGLERFVDPGSKTGGGRSHLAALELAAFSLLWALYWAKSQRVRATFGATALARTITAPDAATLSPTNPPLAPQRERGGWRRGALRVGGVVLALVLALTAYVLWTMRATPYAVTSGADIRATVAGRWAWDSDSAGCRNAHTIAFAEGGKVMTITSGDIGRAEPTTYDVLRVTPSSIRGAIRGEKRLTSEGKPVVWDLVLTGRNEYRWQRTDWPSTPWSFTGKIHRCPAVAAAAEAVPPAR